jgi:DNA-binding beta-propeller fold protein YncE
MILGDGHHRYEWNEKWAQIPDTESARNGWAHHGIVVSQSGRVISFHQADPTVLVFDENGALADSWSAPVQNAHGMSIVVEGGEEFLWLADNLSGRVEKTSLDGKQVQSIAKPDIEVYREGRYSPTGVAVYEERFGGNDDIYVTDGYGSSYIHRYDRNGYHIGSFNGEDGDGGRFRTPHGIWIDTRKGEAELYIADRSNGQIQVYTLDGAFKRAFGTGPGADWLHSPSGFAISGDQLIVAELRGSRVTVLDADDNLVCYLGENSGAFKLKANWPNVAHETLESGRFNSPHGIAADPHGNIFVAEWLIGGRINKLAKLG